MPWPVEATHLVAVLGLGVAVDVVGRGHALLDPVGKHEHHVRQAGQLLARELVHVLLVAVGAVRVLRGQLEGVLEGRAHGHRQGRLGRAAVDDGRRAQRVLHSGGKSGGEFESPNQIFPRSTNSSFIWWCRGHDAPSAATRLVRLHASRGTHHIRGQSEGGVADADVDELDGVEALIMHQLDVLDGPAVLRHVVPPHREAAAARRQAQREDVLLDLTGFLKAQTCKDQEGRVRGVLPCSPAAMVSGDTLSFIMLWS